MRYLKGATTFAILVSHALGFTKVGTTVGTFLKIGTSARALGMGNAYVAVSTGPESFYWNPAGAVWNPQKSITVGYTQWIAGIQIGGMGITYPLTRFTVIGIGVIAVNSGKIEITTKNFPDGTGQMFSYTGTSFSLYISHMAYSQLSVGIAAKVIQEGIYHETATGIAFDFGLRFKTGYRNLVLAMSFSNFGERMKMEGEDLKVSVDPYPDYGGNPETSGRLNTADWAIPSVFRVGISFSPVKPITLSIDGVHPADNKERVHLGIETPLGPMLLRWGYQFKNDLGGLTFGIGFRASKTKRSISLDYAFADMDILGQVHRVSLLVR